MSTPRGEMAAAFLDSTTVVLCAGYYSKCLALCESFDLVTHTFSPFADLIEPRSAPVAVHYNDTVVVIGGSKDGSYLSSCEEYDRETNKWRPFAKLNKGRSYIGAAVSHSNIFVVGSSSDDNKIRIDIFDGTAWAVVTTLDSKFDGCRPVSFGDGKLVLLGGKLDSLEVYDPSSNTFSAPLLVSSEATFKRYWFGLASF